MPTVLITGANRGIGLELARQYAADGWNVLATCRDPGKAAELKAVAGDVAVHRLDVDDPAGVEALAARMEGRPIDVLFNNAGINRRAPSIADIDYAAWAETMTTNVFGPIRVAWALRDNVLASDSKVMAFVSSKMGSVAENTGGSIMYRSSKSALNMAVSCLAKELAGRGAIAVLFHPGHVRTDMGGPSAPVTAPDSAAGMRRVIAGLTPQDNGAFRNFDGTPLPW
ncbi:short-chain dehydrogenase [Thalassobaculum fulvum]|uniref:Short-chain dehydrogenase n=1 Tax=Thalassobaculum fulvum TaxID=1633335 RepID=A0A918XWJ4_9PROT|nr:SDR family oxidoreductase [Thalassobaculum fulvum]GHD59012.1 short-chain dehydrogenase [Thalassobaculum fulvum]